MNMLITSIGKNEEYRQELIAHLKSIDSSAPRNASIETLERLVERQRKNKNG